MRLALALLVPGITLTGRAFAHAGERSGVADGGWRGEPWVVAGLLLAAVWYAAGFLRMHRRAALQRAVGAREVAAFATGMLVLAAALLPPLEAIGDDLFSVHMCQHLLLMLVAAPLLALGAPRVALAWGAPPTRLWRLVPSRPAVAFALHGLALWAWHVPMLYEAALANRAIHAAEHASFLATGVLFWWTLFHRGYGLGVLYVFGMAVQSTILGALLTFARAPWYTSHLGSTAAWGLTPLEDQQLAGLIMWVPGGLIYLAAALTLFGLWLNAGAGPAPGPSTPARRPAERLVSPEP
jgi:putative membrane protein